MSAIVWPLSRDPWKDLTNSHTVANTVWGTNSDLHLLPGLTLRAPLLSSLRVIHDSSGSSGGTT